MKIVKQAFLMAINIFIVLLVFSCVKNQNERYVDLSEKQLYAPQEGTDVKVAILSSTDWEIIAKPDWLQAVSEDCKQLQITVFKNDEDFLRSGAIKMKSEDATFEINVYQASDTQKFEKCYVTFDPDGYKGNSLFLVYTQSTTKPNYYWGFTIAHEQDLSNTVYSDQYRILSCDEYIYNGENMTATGAKLLAVGESEFTYKRLDAADLTGGYHGREKFTDINFFIDGNLIADSTLEFKMRACERFMYQQKSIMYRDDKAHTEDAIHIKTTNISNGGYFTENRITGKEFIPMNTCFGSLVSVSLDVAAKGFDSNDENAVDFNQDGNKKIEGYCDKIYMCNDEKKLAVNIESKFSLYNDYATQCVWDKQRYGKYYRFFQYVNLKAGESWVFETNVTFDKL